MPNSNKIFLMPLLNLKTSKKSTGEESLYAKNAMHQTGTAKLEQKIREEVASKLGESFDSLACAARIKTNIMDNHARIIATLSATNAELVATNKYLVTQLASLTTQKGRSAGTPAGFKSSSTTTPASASHALTTAGPAAPTVYNTETQKIVFR